MPKKPLPPGTTKKKISSASNDKPIYSIGYGKPPEHTRFKPGHSGTPRGRPQRRRDVRSVIEEILRQPIKVRAGDKTQVVTKLDGVFLSIVNGAIKGDTKMQRILISLLRGMGMVGSEGAPNFRDLWDLTILTDEEVEVMVGIIEKEEKFAEEQAMAGVNRQIKT